MARGFVSATVLSAVACIAACSGGGGTSSGDVTGADASAPDDVFVPDAASPPPDVDSSPPPPPPPPPPPAKLESGVWQLSEIHRTQATSTIDCWSALMTLDLGATFSLGERELECGSSTSDASTLIVDVVGSDLFIAGKKVGNFTARVLQLSLPDGSFDVTINLDRPDYQYSETITALGTTTTFTAKLAKRPNGDAVALAQLFTGTEDTNLSGRVHAAKLPKTTVAFAPGTPAKGTLTAFDASTGDFTYKPNLNANGGDAFTFSVGASTASATLTLAAVEDPPSAVGQSVNVVEDTPTSIALTASDPDADPLTLTITVPPTHGTLSGSFPNVTYTPAANYNGSDGFSYTVSDGIASSAVAHVSITVTAVDDAPTATPQTVSTHTTDRKVITLGATDVDNTTFSFAIVTGPSHGTLTGTTSRPIYQATSGYTGDDTFTFTANDGMITSAPATVTIHVLPAVYTVTKLTAAVGTSVQWKQTVGPSLYFNGGSSGVELWTTDGTNAGTLLVKHPDADANGFNSGLGASGYGPRTAFFAIGATSYFTTSTTATGVRLYKSTGGAATTITDIPRPSTAYTIEPAVWGAATVGSTAYMLVQWRDASANFACEVWSTDGSALATSRLYQLPISTVPCSGIWNVGSDQYLFAGTDLMKFTGSTTAPSVVKSVGPGTPLSYTLKMVGSKFFFETNQLLAANSNKYDLWVSDGTAANTSNVATLNSGFLAQGMGPSTSYGGSLYFGLGRGLMSTDGTTLTQVITFPTNSWNGSSSDVLYVLGGKMFFATWLDTTYREPWVSDGTTAGTFMLQDIYPGQHGSLSAVVPEFAAWKGSVFFSADDGVLGPTLWKSDGTSAGTATELDVPVSSLLGVAGTGAGTMVTYYNGSLYAVQ